MKNENLEQLQKEMEGIDQLFEQFDPNNQNTHNNYDQEDDRENYNYRLQVYETDPDVIKNQGFDTIKLKKMRYKPKMESIFRNLMTTSNLKDLTSSQLLKENWFKRS